MTNDRIVSNGMSNLRKAPSTKQRIIQVVADIRAKYEPEMRRAGLIRRLVLWFRMKKVIRTEIKKIVPPKACYIFR